MKRKMKKQALLIAGLLLLFFTSEVITSTPPQLTTPQHRIDPAPLSLPLHLHLHPRLISFLLPFDAHVSRTIALQCLDSHPRYQTLALSTKASTLSSNSSIETWTLSWIECGASVASRISTTLLTSFYNWFIAMVMLAMRVSVGGLCGSGSDAELLAGWATGVDDIRTSMSLSRIGFRNWYLLLIAKGNLLTGSVTAM